MSRKIRHFNKVLKTEGLERAAHLSLKYLISTVPTRGIPYYYQLRSWINWQRSGSYCYQPQPYKIIYIEPSEIKYMSKNRFSYLSNKYYDSGLVAKGDWDLSKNRFSDNVVYESFYQRFVEREDWINTDLVNRALDRLHNGETVWKGCSSKSEVLKKCSEYDALHQDIKNNYLSKKEIIRKSGESPTNPQWFWQAYDEVVVNIGRNGQLLFVGGHHRLSIAKIIGVEQIPVRVFVRHDKWQKRIDKLYSGHKEIPQHPDLIELR